ncbi:related to FMN1 - Riboflavin kinase [Melanopsichium pennsylvanicum]|uniref:Riboflavin kinase n=2 Tax=Melanopsichium pennsylvanicum TaxID=63383 RepID=A0AAJ5C4Q2_9BASI|nr:related to FMN1-Riboflavin kinase [Melanopsichium pennsylvanicum 4]SNX83926.1 related to FMN1 - Riboflavin kinase [Melanopsichium pennsylvanicum]
MPDSTQAQQLKTPTAPSRRPEVCGPHAPERPYPIYLRGQVEKGFGRGSKDLGCPTANLPSRVVGPDSLLTRTGVYFGFARVLPQDPDDPSLTDTEDADLDSTHNPIDDDDNEVVLGASPIGDVGEGFLDRGLRRTRQNSREQPSPQAAREAREESDKEAQVSRSDLSDSARHGATASSSSSSSSLAAGRRKRTKRVALRQQDSQVFPMVMSVGWNPFYKNSHKTAEVHILHEFASDFYGLEIRVVVLGYIRPEYNYDSMDALIEDIEMDKKVTVNSLARPLYQDYSQDPFLGR